MSVNSVFTALMNQVRRITGVSGTLTPEQATLALANANPADLSAVTATAQTVLTGYDFVDANGQVVPGSMTNRGAVSGAVTPSSSNQYTIPQGYHNGSGKVSASVQTKSILFEPDGTKQGFTPDAGKYLTTAYIYPCRMKTYTGKFNWEQGDLTSGSMSKTFVIPANPVLQNYLPTQYDLTIFTDVTTLLVEQGALGPNPLEEPYIMGIYLHRNTSGSVETEISQVGAGSPWAPGSESVWVWEGSTPTPSATVSLSFVTTPVAGYQISVAWNGSAFDVMDPFYDRGCRYILTAWESVPTDTPLAQGDPA